MKDQARFDAELKTLTEKKDAAAKKNDPAAAGIALQQIGGLYLEFGQVDEAIRSLEESERIASGLEDQLVGARTKLLLAQGKVQKGDYEGAEDLLARACEIFQMLDKPKELFDGARRLALLCLRREEREKAQEYAQEAFASVVASGDLALQAEGLDLLEQVSLPVRHYAAFFAVFLSRSFGKDEALFKRYFSKLLDTLKTYFADFRFTEIIDFADVVLANFHKAKVLRSYPDSFNVLERAMVVAAYIGKSRGDRSSGNWRSAERLSEELGTQELLGLDMKKCLEGFVL